MINIVKKELEFDDELSLDFVSSGSIFGGNVRGKSFIEYIPTEYAWSPIDANGYFYINCLWVSGQFKGHGYSTELLGECIRDGKKGETGTLHPFFKEKKPVFLPTPNI